MPTSLSRYYFTADVAMLPEIRATKNPVLRPTVAGVGELYFFEDRAHGAALISGQANQADVAAYEHAVLLEASLDGGLIGELMLDPALGRVAPEVHEMLTKLGRGDAYIVDDGETPGVLVLVEVVEAPEADDGLTHRYRLRCRMPDDPLFERFAAGVRKLAIVGAIPGAIPGH